MDTDLHLGHRKAGRLCGLAHIRKTWLTGALDGMEVYPFIWTDFEHQLVAF